MGTYGNWEHFGTGEVVNGTVDIGGVKVPHAYPDAHIYVRRRDDNLAVIEIGLAMHDGLAQSELDQQNFEAERYPGGPKEYWRGEMVGQGGFTDEEFEAEWAESL